MLLFLFFPNRIAYTRTHMMMMYLILCLFFLFCFLFLLVIDSDQIEFKESHHEDPSGVSTKPWMIININHSLP